MIRLFVLLTWHPALGLAIDPVGVLGMEQTAGGSCTHYVSWIPSSARTSSGWPARLTAAPSMATLSVWLEEHGSLQLTEIPVPPGVASLVDAVELAVDGLLADVVPFLPPAETR
jgi:hypothetical protein